MTPLLQREGFHRSSPTLPGCQARVANRPLGHHRLGFLTLGGALLPASKPG